MGRKAHYYDFNMPPSENEVPTQLCAKAEFMNYGHWLNAPKHGGRYDDDIPMVKFYRATRT